VAQGLGKGSGSFNRFLKGTSWVHYQFGIG
jgi:hypothetical protein